MPDAKTELREWILQNSKTALDEDLSFTTPIIERRLISSIQIMDLLLEIERISGRPVEIEQLKPSAFKNIDSIYETFFQ